MDNLLLLTTLFPMFYIIHKFYACLEGGADMTPDKTILQVQLVIQCQGQHITAALFVPDLERVS